MGHSDDDNMFNPSHPSPVNTRIMIAAIIVLFIVVMFILLLHIYARWFWRNSRLRSRSGMFSRRRRRFSFQGNAQVQAQVAAQSKGLDKAVLDALPVFYYTRKVKESQSKVHPGQATEELEDEAMDCAVCLSEFEENEAGRRLPKCGHVFHTDCIDMWFGSHSTCPLCRAAVVDDQAKVPDLESQGEELLREAAMVSIQARSDQREGPGNAIAIQILQEEGSVLLSERHQQPQQEQQFVVTINDQVGNTEILSGNPNQQQSQFPASVLFWGNQTYVNSVVNSIPQVQQEQGSSSSKKQLVIEVPRRSAGNFSSACSSQMPSPTGDGQRSPLGNHLRNLKRLLSRDSRRSSMDHGHSTECCGESFHSTSGCHTPHTPRSGCQTPC